MAYKQRWLEYFAVLDSDNNGSVDADDLTHSDKVFSAMLSKPADSPEVKAAVETYRDFYNRLIKDFDGNSDGKVSKEEFLAGVEKHFIGKQPSEFPAWWKENITDAFNQLDLNRNGEITEQESVRVLKHLSPHTSEEDIKKAHQWVVKKSPSGKYDTAAYSDIVVNLWATSPDDIPEVTLLTPFFRKQN